MASRKRRPAARHNSSRPLRVDELMVRHGGRPVDLPEPGAPPVSVAALLRREGRGPHSADGLLQPRTHLRAVDVADVPPPRRNARKVTVAAGAMFAIGAIVGPSILTEAAVPSAEAGRGTTLPAAERYGSVQAGDQPLTGPAAAAGNPRLAALFIPDRAVPAGAAGLRTPSAIGAGAQLPAPALPGGTAPGGITEPGSPGLPTDPGGGVGLPGEPTTTPQPPGSQPPGSQPTGSQPTGSQPTGSQPTGSHPAEPGGPGGTHTPPVVIPPVLLPPIIGPATTPGISISPVEVEPPEVTITAGGDTVAVSTSDAHIATPDITTTGAGVGPVGVTGGSAQLPDVSVSGGSVSLSPGGPKVAVPDVSLFGTKVDTPDVQVGGHTIPLPDVELPSVQVKNVGKDPVGAVADTVTSAAAGLSSSTKKLVSGTGRTVGSLLGSP